MVSVASGSMALCWWERTVWVIAHEHKDALPHEERLMYYSCKSDLLHSSELPHLYYHSFRADKKQ